MRTTLAELVAASEQANSGLPGDPGDRFVGYGVMGLPFASGHVLALRRFPVSSVGPAYTSVRHRNPEDRWTFWSDRPADQACPRYFSAALTEFRQVPIDLEWPDAWTLRITIASVELDWN